MTHVTKKIVEKVTTDGKKENIRTTLVPQAKERAQFERTKERNKKSRRVKEGTHGPTRMIEEILTKGRRVLKIGRKTLIQKRRKTREGKEVHRIVKDHVIIIETRDVMIGKMTEKTIGDMISEKGTIKERKKEMIEKTMERMTEDDKMKRMGSLSQIEKNQLKDLAKIRSLIRPDLLGMIVIERKTTTKIRVSTLKQQIKRRSLLREPVLK